MSDRGQIDRRSSKAKRLKALAAGITEADVQTVVLTRLAASLAFEAELLEAAQARGEKIDADQLRPLCRLRRGAMKK